MPIRQYDAVTMKNGKSAVIVEVLESGVAYLADISTDDGWDDDDTITVYQEDIEAVFSERDDE